MGDEKYLAEFKGMKESSARDAIWACVNDAYIRCKSCMGAQKKPYDDGLRTIYRNGWELPHGEYVMSDMSSATKVCPTLNLLERLDQYTDLHCAYDCKAALKNIEELRKEMFSAISNQNGKTSLE
jgi:hypothetical protein